MCSLGVWFRVYAFVVVCYGTFKGFTLLMFCDYVMWIRVRDCVVLIFDALDFVVLFLRFEFGLNFSILLGTLRRVVL